MTGRDIVKQIRTEKQPEQQFIKWWRIENDFLDYELVEDFINNAKPDDVFAGFELLTMEQMWQTIKGMETAKVERGRQEGQDVIFWDQERSDGTVKSRVCPYTPDSLISVFDVVTRGNPVD